MGMLIARLMAFFGVLAIGLMPAAVSAQRIDAAANLATPNKMRVDALAFEELQKFIAEEYKVSADAVTLDVKLADLGGDALNLVFVVGAVEEKYALQLPDHEINGIVTVRDLLYAFTSPGASLAQAGGAEGASVEPSTALLADMNSYYFVGALDRAQEELAACAVAMPGQCIKLLTARSNASLEVMRASGGTATEAELNARALLEAVDRGSKRYRFEGVLGHHNLGVSLTEQGSLKDGEEHLREALRLLFDPNTKELWEPSPKDRTKTPYVQLRRVALDLARNLALQKRYEPALMAFGVANNEANHQGFGAYDRNGAPSSGGGLLTKSIRRDIVDDYTEFGAVLSLIEQAPNASSLDNLDRTNGDATSYFERAYAETAAMPPEAGDYRAILDTEYGIHLARLGRSAEAIEFLSAAQSNLPFGPSRQARRSLAHGESLAALGRSEDALPYFRAATTLFKRALPPESQDRIAAHWALGTQLLKRGERDAALVELDDAVRGASISSFQGEDPAEEARLLRRYTALFATSVEASMRPNTIDNNLAKAFKNAQLASASETAAALAQVSAAMADGSGAMAILEARRRSLLWQRSNADQTLFKFAAQVGAAHTTQESELATSYRTLTRQLAETEEEMGRKDPAYFDLVRPRPLELVELQKLLRTDEALLFLMVGEKGTATFAVSSQASAGSMAENLGDAALTKEIQALRSQLRSDLTGASRGLEREDVSSGSSFNNAAAYALYASLIKPVESVFAGKSKVLVVTTGPLGSLPLQVLPITAPSGTTPTYFGETYSLATLPAVSSLRSLRCFRSSGNRPTACGTTVAQEKRQAKNGPVLAAVGAPTLRGAPGDNRGAPAYAPAYNGELADTEFLRNLPYLPGTRQEIEQISAAFVGQEVLVRTGDDARESFVRSDLGIASAQYLVLSTHGLLQSETGFVGEPGLVFTPPAKDQASRLDDGLLTASEAAQMKLVADLLVLSACNTASSDGKLGAEGLSGLAKAFLYSGVQALLVSHWPVDDRAGAEIVSEMLRLSKNADIDRATSLRQAALLVRKQSKWSSPAFWAPFVLVGLPD